MVHCNVLDFHLFELYEANKEIKNRIDDLGSFLFRKKSL